MLSILVTVLIVVIVVAVIFYILGLLPLPQPWMNVAKAIVALIVLIWLISYLLPAAGLGHPLAR